MDLRNTRAKALWKVVTERKTKAQRDGSNDWLFTVFARFMAVVCMVVCVISLLRTFNVI